MRRIGEGTLSLGESEDPGKDTGFVVKMKQHTGSKWWKFDLHAHTPASYDFKGDDKDFETWLIGARDAGLDAVAVTDHNSAKGIEGAQNAILRVENAPVVFPGVELTTVDGLHLLLIADPDDGQARILDLLSKAEVPLSERGTQKSRSQLNVEKILDKCGDEAVIIAAHVNTEDGILQLRGEQRISVLQHRNLAAVEVNPFRCLDDLSWIDGSEPAVGRALPRVWSSDSHRPGDIGQRFTWIKMTKLNLEGLRLALMDGDSSLIPARANDAEDPNNARASTSIEKIVVNDAKYIGRKSEAAVHFNPWLNAIIGGRGTGKSTLVDFCRKTLGRDADLDDVDGQEEGPLRSMFDRRMTSSSSNGDGLLTDNTDLEVFYLKDGQRFRLAWNPRDSATSIVRLDADGEIPEYGNIRERFPISIYSQKQLFSLSQNPNALLDIIDAAQEARAVEINSQIGQLESSYMSLLAEARSARSRAEALPDRIAAMSDVQRKLDVMQQGGHSRILGVYRFRHRTDADWNDILKSAAAALDTVKDGLDNLIPADLDFGAETPDSPDDAPNAALARAHQLLASVMDNLRSDIAERVAEASGEIEEIRAGVDFAEWRAAVKASQTDYDIMSRQLQEQGISAPTEYSELLDRAAALRGQIEEMMGERDRADALEKQAEETLAEYREKRRRLSSNRGDFASKISSRTLRVIVDGLSGHSDLANRVGNILDIGRFQPDRNAVAERIKRQDGDKWDWSALDGVVSDMRQLQSGDMGSWNSQDRRFDSALKGIDPERIDRLALYSPSDAVRVRFKDEMKKGWQPLEQGSPGQRTAALLAFILSFGNDPIILDQPEDDLDNTVIYELLVNRLKEKKRERQVIVVTHNPNIVVHGDAEYVISLDSRNGRTVVNKEGGLQEQDVRDEICRVMEGGEEAFRDRYRRILSGRG